VLALQGAFVKHEEMLKKLGIPHIQVRYREELEVCEGLIIPGGESTTMAHQILARNLLSPIKEFATHKPIFGTCAGMILMAQEHILSLLKISVARNAYGRQRDSFSLPLELSFSHEPMHALFIRAPKITAIHSKDIEVLSARECEPVLIRQGFHLASSFHPELTNDLRIHNYFFQHCVRGVN
jgi:pyridoxal 5'-phosphate synthase pdxT subunit